MRHGLPVAYAIYRGIWTAVHLALLLVAVIAFAVWFGHDGQGMRVVDAIGQNLAVTQHRVATAIPFPWS